MSARMRRRMPLRADFAFSQGSLGDYVDCARRFELRYIQRLRYPSLDVQEALQYENRLRQGDRFHKLAQQRLLGLPAELLGRSLADDDELRRWWENFLEHGLTGLPRRRYPEITLETQLGGRRLVAKYDLLAIEAGGAAVIVDWKTSPRVPRKDSLEGRMQTVVYRYVLAMAGAHLHGGRRIPPERIRMEYCYVAARGERLRFDYSAAQLEADEARLRRMLADIEAAETFPLTSDERRCQFCNYRSLCDRGLAGSLEAFDFADEEAAEEDFALDFDQIAEIEF